MDIEPIMVVVVLVASFALTMVVTPRLIRKLRDKGEVVNDYYKLDSREVPTKGGILILGVVFLMLALLTIIEHLSTPDFNIQVTGVDWAILIVAGLFGAFGLVDDLVDVGRPLKIIFLYFFSFRLIFEIGSTMVTLPLIGSFDAGIFYLFLIIPLYVLVTANLTNMHSGFNGLASGVSLIIITTLLLKFIVSGHDGVLTLGCMSGAILGFLWYNSYPARIFWGNIGSLSIGAAIGAAIVVSGFLVAGFIMLIPHTINFLMYFYWRVMHKLHPEDKRWKLVKFGKVREDGTLEVPNPLTLKWVLPYYFNVTEKQTVLAMYALTMICCAVAFFVPY
ncbi:MAG: UDP-N-acetylmuramyl pentapeptide phosphotransferase/UDP-N-acetylglucosamine-1-phosphate transferase [Candidatus Syntrophoarchaeum caldarius]|uniref:UDP-N-acetylmuramyl pentapeptide phosphotransferase/UDP-N-acetylglucosamine-1-phosphate transferase n=1 Tax=Candidatus Syntropharchaeum caldarium TaxID=1838285 RepID=A0A1F2P910_9EURY|nr:MAG: UDP-N-acetylmuramyl pentapeptide phosphotransferase/UDP-N-acetylglucosamine-1-phosphate transferase [Candidatus Syntrophoarchaeum caldarius]